MVPGSILIGGNRFAEYFLWYLVCRPFMPILPLCVFRKNSNETHAEVLVTVDVILCIFALVPGHY